LGYGKDKGVKRLVKACGYTIAGFKAAWTHKASFRQEIIMAGLMVPLAVRLGESPTQKAVLIGTYFIIPLTELLNYAIEVTVDRIGPARHTLSGRAKDLGSAAVFMSICIALIVWILIVCERYFK